MDNLLTPKQAAEQYDVTSDTIRKYLQGGKLQGQKLDGRWLITQDEAEKIPCLFYNRKQVKRTFAGDKSTLNDRDRKIISLWEQGKTYQEIGNSVGLSKQRIGVIVRATNC